MSTHRSRYVVIVPLAGLLLAALVACVPSTPAPTSAPSDSPSESPTPTATPEPVAEPLVIPACETLLPLALVHEHFSPSTEFFGEYPASEFGVSGVPEAGAAVAGASQARNCIWAVPYSDGSFTLLVAEITPADRAAVEAALPAAGFSAVTMGTVTGYDAERDGEVSSLADTLLFTGDVMIVCNGTTLDLTGVVTGAALDALRTANPTLGL